MNRSVITSRLSIFTAIILFLFILEDINTRLTQSITLNKNNIFNENITEINPPLLPQSYKKKIEQHYDKYKQTNSSLSKNNQEISLEQQKLQQGKLTSVFVRDKKLTLKAVIAKKSSTNYALLAITNLKDKTTKLVKCEDKGIILDYQLEIKNNTQVYLRYLADKGVPEIILTMYKK